MGAPEGNHNAVKHGLRSKRHGLVHAKLGKRFASAYGHCNQLRREIEALVRQRHGSLSLIQQARVQSLLRLEEGIRACEKAMAESPNMTPEEIRGNRGCIAQWTMQRDNLLSELVGDCKAVADPWAALDAARQTAAPPAADHAADFGIDQGGPSRGELAHAQHRMATAVERTTGRPDESGDQGQENATGEAVGDGGQQS